VGLTLDESVDGLEKLESNGISAWIDPGLVEFLKQYGEINVDYVERDFGQGGYVVSIGKPGASCGDCSCS
jgi:Fe-S cluster assembly iron-binding protein IscA